MTLLQLANMDRLWLSYFPSQITFTRADTPNKLDLDRAAAARQFYLNQQPIDQDSRQEIVDLLGDAVFASPTYKAVQLMSK